MADYGQDYSHDNYFDRSRPSERIPTFISAFGDPLSPPMSAPTSAPLSPAARDSYRRSRASEASNRTWVYTSQQNLPPPPPAPAPIPVPSPARGARGLTELPEEVSAEDEEFMEIDASNIDLEMAYSKIRAAGAGVGESSGARKEKEHTFVGGFVSGLRRLPRAVLRPRRHADEKARPLRAVNADPEPDPEQALGSPLPKYESPTVPPPRIQYPHEEAQAGPSNVQYVEATEMPVEQPASPPPRRASRLSFRRSEHSHGHEQHMYGSPTQPLRVTPHATPASHYAVPAPEAASPPRVSRMASPVSVSPLPTSDYGNMGVRSSSYSGATRRTFSTYTASFSTHVSRVYRFIRDLYNLPWIAADRITVDYHPRATRDAQGHRVSPLAKPAVSWYNRADHTPLDLLSARSISEPASPPHRRHHRHHSYSPRAHRHHHHHGRHGPSARPTPFPMYPQGYGGYQPQPLFVVPQLSQQPGGSPENNAIAGGPDRPAQTQAVPLYVVATSPVGASGQSPYPYPTPTYSPRT